MGKIELTEKEKKSAKEFLLHKAEEHGCLTLDDMMEAFPEAEENLAELEDLFIYLSEEGIQVLYDEEKKEPEEPSPEGLVCVSLEGFEFSGGAHGIAWHRAFIYDTGTGRFVQPLSLLGDSASCEEFRTAVADTLERRLGADGNWIEEGTALIPGNYDALLPLPGPSGGIEGFRVVFDPYQVAPYVFGVQEVVVRNQGSETR